MLHLRWLSEISRIMDPSIYNNLTLIMQQYIQSNLRSSKYSKYKYLALCIQYRLIPDLKPLGKKDEGRACPCSFDFKGSEIIVREDRMLVFFYAFKSSDITTKGG